MQNSLDKGHMQCFMFILYDIIISELYKSVMLPYSQFYTFDRFFAVLI